MVEKLNKIQDRVREILKGNPSTRDSDTYLIMETLRSMGFKIYIDYSEIKEMPSFESITRCRRKIQNEEKLYLPESQRIRDQRQINEDTYRRWATGR